MGEKLAGDYSPPRKDSNNAENSLLVALEDTVGETNIQKKRTRGTSEPKDY
jgi:hypothetical protein